MNKTTFQPGQGNLALSITRRRFIKSLLATWTIASGLPWRFATAEYDAASEDWPAWLQLVTGEPSAVIRLGKAYLTTHPDEQDGDELLRLIDEALSQLPDLDTKKSMQPNQIAMELKRLVRTEYINDAVLNMEGWILSRTEARLYALFAVLQAG